MLRELPVKRGQENFQTKLNDDVVREIRRSKETNVVLAKRYGVAANTIRMIKVRQTWRHVSD